MCINDWSNCEKALWLQACVSGRAHVAYNLLSHEIQESFNLFKAALRERFDPSSKKEYYKLEFERRQKLATESWADLGGRFAFSSRQSLPELQDKARGTDSLSKPVRVTTNVVSIKTVQAKDCRRGGYCNFRVRITSEGECCRLQLKPEL